MTPKHPSCRAIEPDLVATATGEAGAAAVRRVDDHARSCAPCRAELGRYRAIDAIARGLRDSTPPAGDVAASRSALQARLADLKSRVLTYGIVPSPLGNILVARSELGVSLVEYLGEATTLAASRLRALTDVETVESSTEIARLRDELLEFLAGRRQRLGWRLDLRLAGSEFRRAVLGRPSTFPTARSPRTRRLLAAWASPAPSARSRRRCAGIRCPSSSRATASSARRGS
jgi:hypothetical protein